MAIIALFMGALPLSQTAAPKWEAVAPEDFQSGLSAIDPNASAEVIYSESFADFSNLQEYEFTVHQRTRILTAQGAETAGLGRVLFDPEADFDFFQARTIKPDGTFVEVDKKSIFDRVAVKTDSDQRNIRSFTFPSVQPGCIVEYRYRIIYPGYPIARLFSFQNDFPTRVARIRVKVGAETKFHWFNFQHAVPKSDKDDTMLFEVCNIAARQTEPLCPPLINNEPVLVFATSLYDQSFLKYAGDSYWKNRATNLHENGSNDLDPTSSVKKTAAGLIQSSDSSDEKLRKLYEFVQLKVRNTDFINIRDKKDKLIKHVDNDSPTDTLKRLAGMPWDLNQLFISLARAAGFDARWAQINDRSFLIYSGNIEESYALSDRIAAVKVGDTWRYFEPGTPYVRYGALHWSHAGVPVLVADKKAGALQKTPDEKPAANQLRSVGNFTLDAEGNLEGTVTVTAVGQSEITLKNRYHAESPADQEKILTDQIHQYLSQAEISEIKLYNVEDLQEPFRLEYKLKVPAYAEATGSRLFIQPAVFRKGIPVLFPSETRHANLYFHYPETEIDEVSLVLPEGYKLEQASAPAPVSLGDCGSYQPKLAYMPKSRTLKYTRTLVTNFPLIRKDLYGHVQVAYDQIHRMDNHVITIRDEAVTGPAPTPAVTAHHESTTAPTATP